MTTIARNAPGWADEQSRGYAIEMTVTQHRYVLQKYPFPKLDDEGRERLDHAETGARVQPDDVAPGETNSDTHAVSDADAADSSEAGVPLVEEFLSMWQDEKGTFRLTGRFDADAGMVVKAALDESRDRIFQRGEFGASLAEALHEMAQKSLDSIPDPTRRARFRVNLFINTDHADRGMTDATGWTVPGAYPHRD